MTRITDIRLAVWFKINGDNHVGKCFVCSRVIYRDAFHAAHIVADAHGGEISVANLMPTCQACNLKSGTMNLLTYKEEKGFSMDMEIDYSDQLEEEKQNFSSYCEEFFADRVIENAYLPHQPYTTVESQISDRRERFITWKYSMYNKYCDLMKVVNPIDFAGAKAEFMIDFTKLLDTYHKLKDRCVEVAKKNQAKLD